MRDRRGSARGAGPHVFEIRFDDPRLVGRRATLVFTERADGRPDGTVFQAVVVQVGRGRDQALMIVRLEEPLRMGATSALREGKEFDWLALHRRGSGWFPRVAQLLFRQVQVNVFDGMNVRPGELPLPLGIATLTWRR